MRTPSKKHSYPFPFGMGIRRRKAPFHDTSEDMKYCIDFAMTIGMDVLASRAGIVVAAVDHFKKNYPDRPEMSDRANYIIIDHLDGSTASYYVHLAWHSCRVKVSDSVYRGQTIAKCGNTGYSSYPHLHFGVYKFDCFSGELKENIPVIFK